MKNDNYLNHAYLKKQNMQYAHFKGSDENTVRNIQQLLIYNLTSLQGGGDRNIKLS